MIVTIHYEERQLAAASSTASAKDLTFLSGSLNRATDDP